MYKRERAYRTAPARLLTRCRDDRISFLKSQSGAKGMHCIPNNEVLWPKAAEAEQGKENTGLGKGTFQSYKVFNTLLEV